MKIEFTKELESEIANKIATQVRENYFWEAAKSVSSAIEKKLNEDGFPERVASAVIDRIKIDEDEFTKEITAKVKDHLISVVGVIAKETITKIEEKVKSYGFIQIGR